MDKVNIETIKEVFGTPSNNLVVIDDIKNIYNVEHSKQMLIEGYVFVIILEGSANIIIDEVEHQLVRGDLFGCNPRNILEKSMLSMDLKVLGFYCTPEYVNKLLSTIQIDWTFLMMPKTHDVVHADEECIDRLVDYFNLLRKKINAKESEYKQKSIDELIQSMGLEIFDIHEQGLTEKRAMTYSPSENMMQRFMLMLSESSQKGKPYLNVNGYAERLNITPKHFSHVCKKVFGKTASEIINEEIMLTALALLHDNSMSIKQISDKLGFANQSHFGTFFRRNSGGKSPCEIRKSEKF